ncbi:hypothetical protein HQ529_02480 [Candidatus Woesearchaeota archaeon]|nr:hypothetical protein [Candidatus Woesearchaeota archaeon]
MEEKRPFWEPFKKYNNSTSLIKSRILPMIDDLFDETDSFYIWMLFSDPEMFIRLYKRENFVNNKFENNQQTNYANAFCLIMQTKHSKKRDITDNLIMGDLKDLDMIENSLGKDIFRQTLNDIQYINYFFFKEESNQNRAEKFPLIYSRLLYGFEVSDMILSEYPSKEDERKRERYNNLVSLGVDISKQDFIPLDNMLSNLREIPKVLSKLNELNPKLPLEKIINFLSYYHSDLAKTQKS